MASHLRKRYGDREVLIDASLALEPGESVALVGANGSGKSTLLRCCLRLTEPDSGSLELFGQDLVRLSGAELRRLRSRVGLIWQRHNLVPRLSVLSNVIHGALAHSHSPRLWRQSFAPQALREEAMQCLSRVGLASRAEQRADRLSGGEAQRAAIARALMQRPALIMADEPAASLDPAVGEDVMSLFAGLAREEGITLLFVSHDLEQALAHSDRVVGLQAGRIVLSGASRALCPKDLRALYV